MSSQSAAWNLEWVLVGTLVAVALVFSFIVAQSGGFLTGAIERAIDDGRVIMGMTRDDVISSWGSACQSKEHSIQAMGVAEPVAISWTYENPYRVVHFSSDGIVIWVVD